MIYENGGHFTPSALNDRVKRVVSYLRKRTGEFDSIVVRGASGLVVGTPVALALHKPLCIVRKPGENSHAGVGIVNIYNLGKRWLFLDDFAESGATERAVQRKVKMARPEATQVGAFFYATNAVPWGGGTRRVLIGWKPR